jgi:O-antigen/teichoic acid export membrane protein
VSVKKKLIRNTIVNYIIKLWGFVLHIFLFAFILGHVGPDDYGIYFFVAAIFGLFGFLDLGIGHSLVKFVAEYHAKDDKEKLNEVINTTFFIFLFIGFVGAMILFMIGTFLLNYLVNDDIFLKAQAIMYLIGANFMFGMALSSLKGILAGLQRYDILALITFVVSLVNLSVTVLVLSWGGNIVDWLFFTTIAGSLGFVLTAWYIQRLAPHITISLYYLRRGMIKVLMDLSMSVFLLQVFVIVIYQTDKIVIGLLLNVTLITFYQAALTLYGIPSSLPSISLYAIIPAASELEATENLQALKKLFLRATKYVLAFCLALAVPLFFLSRDMLTLYLGDEYGQYYIIVQILTISLFFDFNNYVATQILIGMNKIQKFVKYYGIVAVMNLGLSVYLVQQGLGLRGVALGTTIPFALLEVFFLRYVFKVLDIKWKTYAKQVFAKTFPIAAVTGAFMFGLIFLRAPYIVGIHPTYPSLFRDIIELGGYFAAGCGFYLLLFYYLGLEKYEKEEIRQMLSGLRSRLKFWSKKEKDSQTSSEDNQ